MGVAFVGVCLAVVPSRAGFPALTHGTAVGWGAVYEWFVMLQSPTSALTPPRIIARAPRRRVQPPPLGGGGLRSRVGRPRTPYQRAARAESSVGSPTVIVRACIISLGQSSGCVGWVAHRLLAPCSVLGVAVKPVLLTYLLTYLGSESSRGILSFGARARK